MSFQKALAKGKNIEDVAQNMFPNLTPSGTLAYDFNLGNKKVEIKGDYTSYPNIFLEAISNDTKNSPGGPFQSLLKGVDYYVYIFALTNTAYVFKTADLCWFLFANAVKYKKKTVKNKTYNTIGYAIPIVDLQHLTTELPK
jgi:hypothetical protein